MTEQITSLDLSRGWYMSTDKKEGTPNGWIMTTLRGMTAWGDCDMIRKSYISIPGTCNGAVCPPPDCRLPQWATDFKNNSMMEYTSWLINSDVPAKQKLSGMPLSFKVGAVLVVAMFVTGTVIAIIKIRKKK